PAAADPASLAAAPLSRPGRIRMRCRARADRGHGPPRDDGADRGRRRDRARSLARLCAHPGPAPSRSSGTGGGRMRRLLDTASFHALGTTCTLGITCTPLELAPARAAAAAARAEIAACERVLTRF